MYINDLTENLRCNVKLFADDTSLFTVVHDPDTAALDMNHDLNLIKLWAHNWRMAFNPDPAKQAVEVTFSRKRITVDHPRILFIDTPVLKAEEHKHLGIVLDSRLSFARHIQTIITKSRQGTGMLRFLSKYLPRQSLNELYNLYVRPHLDYGDVIYHTPQHVCEFSQNITLSNQMEKLESIQYSAALAVTGAWKGTSRVKLYDELGWESLNLRRWYRRLVLFYKIVNNLTPDYTRIPIPPLRQSSYSLRYPATVGQINARTACFSASFYPSCLLEWNKLPHKIRKSPTIGSFKNKLLPLIRPPPKPVYSIHDPRGLAILTQLRVGLSMLNLHKFRHNSRDTLNPMCPSNDGVEDTEHFLLHCHSYDACRTDLLDSLSSTLQPYDLPNLSNALILKLIPYGDERLSVDSNSEILKATLRYTYATQRFE